VKFDQYIAALLEDHDCVIVPDFGGFVANYASAKVNPINHRFDPPYRKISFNKLLVHNDGLLGAYVARKEEERYEDSIKDLKNYALYLKKELRENKKVTIEKVGLLLLQSDGTYRFEQVKNPAFFRDGFGLEAFFGKKIERKPERVMSVEPKAERAEPVPETAAPVSVPKLAAMPVKAVEKQPEPKVVKLDPAPEKKVENPLEIDDQAQDKKRRIWPIAAAAVLGLPIIGYAVWIALNTPLFREPSTFELSDLNPFGTSVPAKYEERTNPFEANAFASTESIVIEDNEAFLKLSMDNAPDKTLVVRLVDPKPTAASSKDLHYHIIGGCFSVASNAEGLVDTYRRRGSNASILDKKGDLSRVSIASYATKKEALVALASYQNDISGAWLLYK